MKKNLKTAIVVCISFLVAISFNILLPKYAFSLSKDEKKLASDFRKETQKNAADMLKEGQEIFRFDTFGDEVFWTDTVKLHQAIQGEKFGGVGPGVGPGTALSVGLKVDVGSLPQGLKNKIKQGKLDLDDPATTLELLRRNAVVGLKGTLNPDGTLKSIGITCAICHSTVDNSLAFGVGQRLDGWANHDLNVGAIVALSPDLSAFVNLLKIVIPTIDEATVKTVLNSWGSGKYDAELNLDGKAFNPQQITNGVVTGTNIPGATLIPSAFGLAGVNQHTWTGAWGTVPYWNAYVANLQMHGIGTFFDPRLDDEAKYPIAAAQKFGHIQSPGNDLITSKLAALHFYQLSLPAPKPVAGVHFNPAAATRGASLFDGKAKCATCHTASLDTEPGWNLHTPEEMKVDSFQAGRAPDNVYRTMNLAGIFVRELGLFMAEENKGRFYHDGRFETLMDVVDSYDTRFSLGLTSQEKSDLVEYLKSL